MEQAVNKLVDLFAQAVDQLGGQAARLYPEVVKVYMIEQITPFLTFLSGSVVLTAVFLFSLRRWIKTEKEFPWAPLTIMPGAGLLFTWIFTMVEFQNALRAWVSPEAAFVLDHVRRLMAR